MRISIENRKRLIGGTVFAVLLSILGLGQVLLDRQAQAQDKSASGYVLAPDGGEQLKRGPTSIRVKTDPTKGAKDMALGTQLLPKGAGIPVHQHVNSDEVLYVLEGTGVGILGDTRSPLEKGSAVFIPRGSWHGVENAERDLLVMWVAAPPGLESFFREASPAPGSTTPPLSREQTAEIARKYGTIFK